MSWYSESISAINKVIREKGRQNITKKDIDNAYPFGERSCYPYKAWLKTRKEKLIELGLIESSDNDLGLFN